ncbi:dnaJ homolog subfamily C member 9-like [Helicoverpa armigera]|uniref:dnaJ homolog subfamily C member 9-like n=1 Tax=Helicoverpa armigera TaxID=29058 RepID=UPI0030839D59
MCLLELCEKYFQTTNLYEVLQIPETASDKEVKKAYHKLSLKIHPDKVEEDKRLEATEKFKVLRSIYEILMDQKRRSIYDATKSVNNDNFNVIINDGWDWDVYWPWLFIMSFLQERSSAVENQDINKAYLASLGDMNYIVIIVIILYIFSL